MHASGGLRGQRAGSAGSVSKSRPVCPKFIRTPTVLTRDRAKSNEDPIAGRPGGSGWGSTRRREHCAWRVGALNPLQPGPVRTRVRSLPWAIPLAHTGPRGPMHVWAHSESLRVALRGLDSVTSPLPHRRDHASFQPAAPPSHGQPSCLCPHHKGIRVGGREGGGQGGGRGGFQGG